MCGRSGSWENPYVADDEQLWHQVDELVRRTIDADDPWDAYKLAGRVGGLVLESDDLPGAYQFWMGLTDLFDDIRLGIIPAEGAQAVLRMAAKAWLKTPPSERPQYLTAWSREDPVALVKSLGHAVGPPPNPRVEQPWRGQWETIAWAVAQIGRTHSPYAAAQRVMCELRDPVLREAGRADDLAALLRAWDATPSHRDQLERQIRQHLRSLSASDVPPLV